MRPPEEQLRGAHDREVDGRFLEERLRFGRYEAAAAARHAGTARAAADDDSTAPPRPAVAGPYAVATAAIASRRIMESRRIAAIAYSAQQ